MNPNQMRIVIGVDAGPAEQGSSRANRALSSIERTAVQAARQMSTGFRQAQEWMARNAEALERYEKKLRSVGQSASIGLTAPLIAFATLALRATSAVEDSLIGFETALGSAKKAEAFLRSLQQYAANTPFEFKGLREQANLLLAAQFRAKEIIPLLNSVGNAVSAAGGDSTKLQSVVNQLAQMKTGGRLALEDLKILSQAGLPVFKILSEELGVTTEEFRKMLEKGIIPAEEGIDALLRGFNRYFAGGLDKRAKTISGQFSNLKDQIEISAGAFGKALVPQAQVAINVLQSLLRRVNEGVTTFQQLPVGLQNTVVGMVSFTVAIGPAALALSGLIRLVQTLAASLAVLRLANVVSGLFALQGALSAVVLLLQGNAGITGALLATEAAALRTGVALAAVVGVPLILWWKENTEWGRKFGDTLDWIYKKLGIIGMTAKEQEAMETNSAKMMAGANDKLAESLKARGVITKKGVLTDQQYNEYLRDQVTLLDGNAKQQAKLADEIKKRQQVEDAAKRAEQQRKTIAQAEKDAMRDAIETNNKIKFGNFNTGLKDVVSDWNLRQEQGFASARERNTRLVTYYREFAAAMKAVNAETQKTTRGAVENAPVDISDRSNRQMAALREITEQTQQLQQEAAERQLTRASAQLERERELALTSLEKINQNTLAGKLTVEQRKLAIELEFQEQSALLAIGKIANEHATELLMTEAMLQSKRSMKLISAEQEKLLLDAVNAKYRTQAQEAEAKLEDTRVTLRAQSEARQAQLAQDSQQRTFEQLKSSAGSLFDQLASRSQSLGQVIASAFKTAMLTAIKEVVTSQVAMLLMGMMGGGQAGTAGAKAPMGASGGGGGLLGSLGGLLGLGSMRSGGGGIAIPNLGPGGTPGFAGPVSQTGTSNRMGTGLSALLSGGGLKSFLGFGGGSVATGAGTATTTATMSGKLTALGTSNAAMMAGGGLAFDGLRRGGITGLAETTAGGALLGFQYGGPIGSAIGAAAGAAAGFVRLFMKGAEEKAIQKAKALYGLTINKDMAKQIVAMAKATFGGNLDSALRSKQAIDLLQLYAMHSGQPFGAGVASQVRAASLSLQSGTLSQAATYTNGQAVRIDSYLPSVGNAMTVPSSQPKNGDTYVTVSIPGQDVAAYLQGQQVRAIANNPRAVADSVQNAQAGSYTRREAAINTLSPGLITG